MKKHRLQSQLFYEPYAVWLIHQVYDWLLRHADDHEVQPIPRVSEEGEVSDAESSRQNFDRCFKCVDACEHISVQQGNRENKKHKTHISRVL